jgi:hypothetical protein
MQAKFEVFLKILTKFLKIFIIPEGEVGQGQRNCKTKTPCPISVQLQIHCTVKGSNPVPVQKHINS